MSRDWLLVARTAGMSGRKLLELLPATGGLSGLLALSDAEILRLGVSQAALGALRQPDERQLEADFRWLEQPDCHLLPIDHVDYPPLLKRIPSPPAVLFVRGRPEALWQPQIAMVGSRNPTAGGLAHTRDFAGELARNGWAITSGLAAGVDVTAHQATLDRGGVTIAVLGTGPDVIYPRQHAAVVEAIVERGAVVTEFAPGTAARREHFPSRNRIISGLSLGVLVVEAALNSGSLITARLGAEQGREVFALPGSLHNPLAKGCHRLIKQGARLAENTGDIIQELAPMAAELAAALGARLAVSDNQEAEPGPKRAADQDVQLLSDPDYAALWEALGHDPLTADQLVARSGLPGREVSSMLLMLELRGMVQTLDGGRFMRDPQQPVPAGGS